MTAIRMPVRVPQPLGSMRRGPVLARRCDGAPPYGQDRLTLPNAHRPAMSRRPPGLETATGGQMRIGIIGAGNVGSSIARAAQSAGHDVVLTATDADKARQVAESVGGSTADGNAQLAREADLVVLAVPWGAVPAIAGEISGGVDGKVIIDATNPIKADFSGLDTTTTSGAEQVQQMLRGASVVKAFNT